MYAVGRGGLSLLNCGRPLVSWGKLIWGAFLHIQALVGITTSSAVDAVATEFVVTLQDSWGVARYVVGLGLLMGGGVKRAEVRAMIKGVAGFTLSLCVLCLPCKHCSKRLESIQDHSLCPILPLPDESFGCI